MFSFPRTQLMLVFRAILKWFGTFYVLPKAFINWFPRRVDMDAVMGNVTFSGKSSGEMAQISCVHFHKKNLENKNYGKHNKIRPFKPDNFVRYEYILTQLKPGVRKEVNICDYEMIYLEMHLAIGTIFTSQINRWLPRWRVHTEKFSYGYCHHSGKYQM